MKNSGWIATAAVAVLVTSGAAPAFADEEAAAAVPAATNVVKQQTMCPVMDDEINKKFFADYQGKRVYFCCNACPARFKKDPTKYITKMEAEGITLEKTPQAAATDAPEAVPPRREKGHEEDEHSGHGH